MVFHLQAVAQWQAKVEKLQPDVVRVHVAEREEKELRKAEMEASKMQNLIDHETEIFARPARSWFQVGNAAAMHNLVWTLA